MTADERYSDELRELARRLAVAAGTARSRGLLGSGGRAHRGARVGNVLGGEHRRARGRRVLVNELSETEEDLLWQAIDSAAPRLVSRAEMSGRLERVLE